ncbi:threonine synthase [Methylocystis sp.]|uniref:threonine synthase n=1 Tax=Methylocystis sp. TaxID=1911079 RepID=UPI003DA52A3D
MRYLSTRGSAPSVDFKSALLNGLAPDGGLYVPESVPQLSTRDIASFAHLSYQELALEIMMPFVGTCFTKATLQGMIDRAYSTFRHAAIAPLTQLSYDHFLLELFHGPTLAFKDFALQLVGQLLEASLKKGERAVVLGATSGDTGSAAIAGCIGRSNLDIVILYPHGRTSEVQRKQMTTYPDKNVHALAVDGTFDDCQDLVKTMFSDQTFRQSHRLLAVNSINWARVLAQVVYYFYAALALGAPARRVNFTVPTGNFGDIYAGYVAQQMGLPMGKLVIATNKNDILARCVKTGEYKMNGVSPTLSPSMDIEISSNFERLLFDLHGRDGAMLATRMKDFRTSKSLTLTPAQHTALTTLFAAHTADDAMTLTTIKHEYTRSGTLLDPHTATGIAATQALQAINQLEGPTVTLATAHPAKFPEAIEKATKKSPELPAHLADLMGRSEKITPLANDITVLKDYISAL